ncbi:MAG: hypothetical protein A2339_05035 [Elusimicrobia bacterium RIFOXYB12_FULL_50_12]|nr:MAG: hypothetical protein A2278_04120 [Elusimicrobia bacterium RIFOXYA12_FULL_49_49]OGS15098.1 MAG: hypothetical protein A2251_00290 [Elusimicrobia bacterium RIFOXYA2_FULL_47_53]OGS27107.1 MAG: hypothetical protein A2339_05035 [Elusimicrobia bacterium RIFOXYB12_FULL_50_12]OGS29718.1 MAG: hypothetical protein A2323_01090 [Elusimicrobia bacterium RIFOXYB2_FULL_46_23]
MEKKSILVIDDDEYIRKACVELFKSEGYEVFSADSGEGGIEVLKANPCEIVITDLKLPEMDGLAVLKHIKDNYSKTDVIMITAHGTIANAVQAMKLGAYDYVPKTFDITELDLIVKRCFEKQRLSAEISELKQLVNLYEVSKAISSIMGLDELLNLILKLSSDTLSADSGSIMLYDSKANELTVKVAIGSRKDDVINKKLSLGERIAGYSAKELKPVVIQGDVKNDPRFLGLEPYEDIKSALTAPLMRKGRLLGVINLARVEREAVFSEQDLNLLSIFAVEAAIAIENTYLFNSLEQEKEELNATFSAMADGAVVTDAGFNVMRLNNSARELLGLSETDSLDRSFIEMIPDYAPSLPWETINSDTARSVNFELSRVKGKSLFLSVMATKIAGQDKNVIGHIFVLRDITEEKKEGKQKIDFLALISHKLRTPLTAINGYSSLLLEKAKDLDKLTRQALTTIEREGNTLNLLVDKLIRFTLLESEYTELTPERISIKKVVDTSLLGLGAFLDKNKTTVIVGEELSRLPDLMIDTAKIIEVVENIVENAVKFNDKPEKIIHINGGLADNNFVMLQVSDNGLGIPSEEHKKIFQKFYQIDEYKTGQVEGAGLGLAVVKKILELHGGSVWIESKIEKGSKFCFTLPRWQDSQAKTNQ